MIELLKKDYELEILWQTLRYKQLSMYDCMEFSYEMSQDWFKLEDWIFIFLSNKINIKKTDLLKIDLNKFMEVMFDTAFKGFFGKKKSSKGWMPLEAYIMILSEKFSLDPETLLKRYTPEQISTYTDWIIYNANEQTKEWQRKNKIRQQMKEIKAEQTPEEALKQINDLKEKRKQYLANKNK